MAATAQPSSSHSSNITLSPQQFEQLMKLLPNSSNASPMTVYKGGDTDEELENFLGMVSCNHVVSISDDWILDSGESDHMTAHFSHLSSTHQAPKNLTINLPTGDTSTISHIGTVLLPNNLTLNHVLYVPQFQHNLLTNQTFVSRDVMFHETIFPYQLQSLDKYMQPVPFPHLLI